MRAGLRSPASVLWLFLSFLLLGGCASRGPEPAGLSWQVQGRAVLILADKRQSLRFRAWRQGDARQMELIAPLGQGRWQLGMDAVSYWLRDGRGLALEDEAVNPWLSERLGLPVRLDWWFDLLRNRPPEHLAQAGWRLEVQAEPGRPRCPQRVHLRGEAGQVVLLLKQWQGRCV